MKAEKLVCSVEERRGKVVPSSTTSHYTLGGKMGEPTDRMENLDSVLAGSPYCLQMESVGVPGGASADRGSKATAPPLYLCRRTISE